MHSVLWRCTIWHKGCRNCLSSTDALGACSMLYCLVCCAANPAVAHTVRSRYGAEVRNRWLLCGSKTVMKSEKSTERPRVQVEAVFEVEACMQRSSAH